MPEPDPFGISMERDGQGGYGLTAEIWWHGNRRNRIARMQAIARKLRLGGWLCEHCGQPVPINKRADARYCRERCRKAAARIRRSWRTSSED